jgi:hypothetical protein
MRGVDEHRLATSGDTYELMQYVNDPIEGFHRGSAAELFACWRRRESAEIWCRGAGASAGTLRWARLSTFRPEPEESERITSTRVGARSGRRR